ncbi:MAG: hypothetical protein HRT99_03605 [Mycoplasmatales bacterium]|nr:hypothetical protein [Mycoplasmatales bacterium]
MKFILYFREKLKKIASLKFIFVGIFSVILLLVSSSLTAFHNLNNSNNNQSISANKSIASNLNISDAKNIYTTTSSKNYLDNQNGNIEEKYEIPENIDLAIDGTGLSFNKIETVSLANLGKIKEVFFDEMTVEDSTTKLNKISEIQLLDSTNKNIGYYVDEKYTTNDSMNQKTKLSNDFSNLNKVLNDQETKINKFHSLNDLSSFTVSEPGLKYFLGLKLFTPTYLSSLMINTNYTSGNYFKLKFLTEDNVLWELSNSSNYFQKSEIFSNGLSLGLISDFSSKWNASYTSLIARTSLTNVIDGKGFITGYYKGDIDEVIDGTEKLDINKVKIGYISKYEQKNFDMFAISDDISVKDFLIKASGNDGKEYIKYLSDNNLIKKTGENVKFINSKPKVVDFSLKAISPFDGLFRRYKYDNVYLQYSKIWDSINKFNRSTIQKLNFEYRFQTPDSQKKISWINGWRRFYPGDPNRDRIFVNGMSHLKEKFNLPTHTVVNIPIYLEIRVYLSSGYVFSDSGTNFQRQVYDNSNFTHEGKKYNFQPNNITISQQNEIFENSLDFMGEVKTIQLKMRPNSFYSSSNTSILSELKILDENGQNVNYSILSQWLYDVNSPNVRKNPSSKEDNELSHDILTDNNWDLKKSYNDRLNDNITNNEFGWDTSIPNKNSGIPIIKSSFNSKKRILSNFKTERNNNLPALLIRLDTPKTLSKVMYMNYGQEREFIMEFFDPNGNSWIPKTYNSSANRNDSDEKNINYKYPLSNNTFKGYEFEKNWRIFGEKANSWKPLLDSSESSVVNPDSLSEIGEVFSGEFSIPAYGSNSNDDRIYVNSLKFYDDEENELEWEIYNGGMFSPNKPTNLQSGEEIHKKLTENDDEGLRISDFLVQHWPCCYNKTLYYKDYLFARQNFRHRFNFRFKDQKPHKISKITIGTKLLYSDNNFVNYSDFHAADVLLYGANAYYELDNFNPSKNGAVHKNNVNSMAELNIGINGSSSWIRNEYINAKFSLYGGFADFEKELLTEYKLMIFNEISGEWENTNNFKFKNILNINDIRFRIFKRSNSIFMNGKYFKELKLSLPSEIKIEDKISTVESSSIEYYLSSTEVIGIEDEGIFVESKEMSYDKNIFGVKYEVIKSDGTVLSYLEPPKNLSNGDRVVTVFFTKNGQEIIDIKRDGTKVNIGRFYKIEHPIISSLPDSKDNQLLSEIPNISEYINDSTKFNASFVGVNGQASASADFINELSSIENKSNKIDLIIKVVNNNSTNYLTFEQFKNYNKFNNDTEIEIFLSSLGGETFSYNDLSLISRYSIFKSDMQTISVLQNPNFINESASTIIFEIEKSIGKNVISDPTTKKNFFELDKTQLLNLSNKYNDMFDISLVMSPINKNDRTYSFESINALPNRLETGYIANFFVFTKTGNVFGNQSNYLKVNQTEKLSKRITLDDIVSKDSSASRLLPYYENTIDVIPDNIREITNIFGELNNEWIDNMVNSNYQMIIKIDSTEYLINKNGIKNTVSNKRVNSIHFINGKFYSITIKPEENYSWISTRDDSVVPSEISKTGVANSFYNPNKVSNLIPDIYLSIFSHDESYYFVDKDNNRSSFLINESSFNDSEYEIKYLSLKSDDIIFNGQNIDNISNGLIEKDKFKTANFNFKKGDWLILTIKPKTDEMKLDGYLNYYVKYIKIPKIAELQNHNLLPKKEDIKYIFSSQIPENGSTESHQIMGNTLNWNDLTKNGNTISAIVKAPDGTILRELEDITGPIRDLNEGEEITIKIDRGIYSWWEDENGKIITSIESSYIVPPTPSMKFIKNANLNKDKFSSKISYGGGEEKVQFYLTNNVIGSELLPDNFDWEKDSAWTIIISIYDNDDNLIDISTVIPTFESADKLKDIKLENYLNANNGYKYSLSLQGINGVQFGDENNSTDILEIIPKTEITGLYKDFFNVVNISTASTPVITGISDIVTGIDSLWDIYDDNSDAFDPIDGLKIDVNHKKAGVSDEILTQNKRTFDNPIKNGDTITLSIKPNHNKYMIDPQNIIFDDVNGTTSIDSNDIFVKEYIISDLPLGINNSVLDKYINSKNNMINIVYTENWYLFKAKNHLNTVMDDIKKDNLEIYFEIFSENNDLIDTIGFDDLSEGYRVEKDKIGISSFIRTSIRSRNGYKIYSQDSSNPNNVVIINQENILNETVQDVNTFDDLDIATLEYDKDYQKIDNYHLSIKVLDEAIIDKLKSQEITVEANIVSESGSQKFDIMYSNLEDDSQKNVFLIEEEAPTWKLILQFGSLKSINDNDEINEINIEFKMKDFSLDKFVNISNTENMNKISRVKEFIFYENIVSIPSIWNNNYYPTVKEGSYENNVDLIFGDNVKSLFVKPTLQNDFYYSIYIYNEKNNYIGKIENIFDWSPNSSDRTINFDLIKTKLNNFSNKDYTLVFEADIWIDGNSSGEKIFDRSKTARNNIPALGNDTLVSQYVTHVKLSDIKIVNVISKSIWNTFVTSSFSGPKGDLPGQIFDTLKDLPDAIYISLLLKNQNGDLISEGNNLDNSNIIKWIEDNILKNGLINNDWQLSVKFTSKNGDLLKYGPTTPSLEITKNIIFKNIKGIIRIINNLGDDDFKYTPIKNGFTPIFDYERIFGKNYDSISDKLLFDLKLISSVSNQTLLESKNIKTINDVLEFIKQATIDGTFKVNDYIDLKIHIDNNVKFVFDNLGNTTTISKLYLFNEENIIKNLISISPIEKETYTKHTLDNGEKVSISGYDKLLLGGTIQYYNELGLDVIVSINGVLFKNEASLPNVSNGNYISITIVPKEPFKSSILIENVSNDPISQYSISFIIEKMLEPVAINEPDELKLTNSENASGTLDIDWINNQENLLIKYHIKRRKKSDWEVSEILPFDLENGDEVYIEIIPKTGYILSDKNGKFSKNISTKSLKLDSLTSEVKEPIFEDNLVMKISENGDISVLDNYLLGLNYWVIITYDDATTIRKDISSNQYIKIEDFKNGTSIAKTIQVFSSTQSVNDFFNYDLKKREVESRIYKLFTEIIEPSDFIVEISEMKQNSFGTFEIIDKVPANLKSILKISYSIDGINFSDEIPTQIPPGTKIVEKIVPLLSNAIIISSDSNEFNQVIYSKDRIIGSDTIDTIPNLVNPKIIGANKNSFLSIQDQTVKWIEENNLELFGDIYNKNGDFIKRVKIDDTITQIDASNGDQLSLVSIPKEGYFFINGEESVYQNVDVDNLPEDKNESILFGTIAIGSFLALGSLGFGVLIFMRRRRN